MKLTIELDYDYLPPERDPWFVKVAESRGCMSQGSTLQEALGMIQEALLLWLEVGHEDGELTPQEQEMHTVLLAEKAS